MRRSAEGCLPALGDSGLTTRVSGEVASWAILGGLAGISEYPREVRPELVAGDLAVCGRLYRLNVLGGYLSPPDPVVDRLAAHLGLTGHF